MHHILFIAIAIAISLPSAAHAQTGWQVIEGTRVYTEIFQSQGYAKFSNDCGSQTLTQRQLQAGAIPRDIIPCPARSNRQQSGSSTVPSDREVSIRVGKEAVERGDRSFKAQDYTMASTHYGAAAYSYKKAGDSDGEKRAKERWRHATCFSSLIAWTNSLRLLKTIRGDPDGRSKDSSFGTCKGFKDGMALVDARISKLEEKEPKEKLEEKTQEVENAISCITIGNVERVTYQAKNECMYKVVFVLETMEFHPKKLKRESLYVESLDTENHIYSYHAHKPTVLSACKGGAPGCK